MGNIKNIPHLRDWQTWLRIVMVLWDYMLPPEKEGYLSLPSKMPILPRDFYVSQQRGRMLAIETLDGKTILPWHMAEKLGQHVPWPEGYD